MGIDKILFASLDDQEGVDNADESQNIKEPVRMVPGFSSSDTNVIQTDGKDTSLDCFAARWES